MLGCKTDRKPNRKETTLAVIAKVVFFEQYAMYSFMNIIDL